MQRESWSSLALTRKLGAYQADGGRTPGQHADPLPLHPPAHPLSRVDHWQLHPNGESKSGRRLYQWFFSSQDWYLAWNMDTTNKGELQFQLSLLAVKMFVEDILTFIILYNNLIPIS
jgi:hypothetical protein